MTPKISAKQALEFATSAFLKPQYLRLISVLLICGEILLNYVIIKQVRYTEIDWTTYMQQCELFLNGTRDYMQLKGSTGPLVYPAGFLYIYSLLYLMTNAGHNIRLAQYIFLFIYIIQLWLTFRLYSRIRTIPPYALVLMTVTSYRIHSIYVLRMFNDPVAILFLYMALNAFIDRKWNWGAIFYSIAVSVKMNILLMAPYLFLFFVTVLPLWKLGKLIVFGSVIQFGLAMPFLLVNPVAYLQQSFDLGRVFDYKWTVNYRFLPPEVFVHKYFHIGLLICHVLVLALFATSTRRCFVRYRLSGGPPLLLLLPVFVSNLIGVSFARSLHYQFYSWYFHSLPLLVFSTTFSGPTRLLLLGLIELCWNTYPSTALSSITLHACHCLLLIGLYKFMNSNNFYK